MVPFRSILKNKCSWDFERFLGKICGGAHVHKICRISTSILTKKFITRLYQLYSTVIFSNGSFVLCYFDMYVFSIFIKSDNGCFKRNASGRFCISNAVIYRCTLWIFTEAVARRCSIKKVLLKEKRNSYCLMKILKRIVTKKINCVFFVYVKKTSLKVAAFVIFPTSVMVLFEIHQKVKGHFLNELCVYFKNFAKFTGKHLCPSLFLNKVIEHVWCCFWSTL